MTWGTRGAADRRLGVRAVQHPDGLSHGLGRRIGASYGVPHGYTSCVTLAPSLEIERSKVPEGRWRRLEEAPRRTRPAASPLSSRTRAARIWARWGAGQGDLVEISRGFGTA